MNKDISIRIAGDVILVISIIMGWWFITIPFAIVGAWVFPLYLEILVLGFIHDALFGMHLDFGVFGYVYIIASIIILFVTTYLKKLVKD